MNSTEVEYALVCNGRKSPFHLRRYVVVPNVGWGLDFLHELDLLALSPSGYVTEIEIKISLSDLKADKLKKHGHVDCYNRIRRLYFAGPESLSDAFLEHAPNRAGVIVVSERKHETFCREIRRAKINTTARKLTEDEKTRLLRLAYMRIWKRAKL